MSLDVTLEKKSYWITRLRFGLKHHSTTARGRYARRGSTALNLLGGVPIPIRGSPLDLQFVPR